MDGRQAEDEQVALVALDNMHPAILRGMAPPTDCNWEGTFWGQQIASGTSETSANLLGQRSTTPEAFRPTLQEAWQQAKNSRQCMDEVRGGFGEGVQLDFPSEIEAAAPDEINIRRWLTEVPN